jgi:putative phosphoesterase
MRIGLLSDTHIPEARGSLWPQVFDAFRDVDLILHAGDVHDFALLDELERLAPLYVARGDGDDGSGGRPTQPADVRVREVWCLELEGLAVGLVHGLPIPEIPPRITMKSALERHFPARRPDVVVYGDSHVEAVDEIEGVLCVNPGSPTYPHNHDTQLGTIAFLEIDRGAARVDLRRLTEQGHVPWQAGPWRPL